MSVRVQVTTRARSRNIRKMCRKKEKRCKGEGRDFYTRIKSALARTAGLLRECTSYTVARTIVENLHGHATRIVSKCRDSESGACESSGFGIGIY